MADVTSVDLARRVGEDLETPSPDLLRAMVQAFAEALMSADADAVCGARYGQVSEDRGEPAQWVPGAAVGYPGGHGAAPDPRAGHSAVRSDGSHHRTGASDSASRGGRRRPRPTRQAAHPATTSTLANKFAPWFRVSPSGLYTFPKTSCRR